MKCSPVISSTALTFLFICIHSFSATSQIRITGDVVDSLSKAPLAYVNIGIRGKNIGTSSQKNGSFVLNVPPEFLTDTLTFSMVGYSELDVPIGDLNAEQKLTILLNDKTTLLNELLFSSERLVERKYGIKNRGVVHFTDGIFNRDDSFEIGQVINLGDEPVLVAALNLHINASRDDSASFRINFYSYDEDNGRPAYRVVEKNILQRHPIREGWLRFDLIDYNILLKGKVFASIEFIPENKEGLKQIYYEVKIGGTSKSFYRRNSLGQWNVPPHHYCLFASVMVDKRTREEKEDTESSPTVVLKSSLHRQPFSIYVRLPAGYRKKSKYPVIYHLDGNAYFDPVCSSVDRLIKKKKIKREPIVVGIGYENGYIMDSLRNRDYTFPEALQADSFNTSGGGDKFYEFIRTTLNPYLEKTYNIDTTRRAIMGHSLGGYFVLYALLLDLDGRPLFNNYVAASPSISYFDNYLYKRFNAISDSNLRSINPKLYLSIGQLEIYDDQDRTFFQFGELLSKYPFMGLKIKVYENMEHMGTAAPSFEDGIAFVLKEL